MKKLCLLRSSRKIFENYERQNKVMKEKRYKRKLSYSSH